MQITARNAFYGCEIYAGSWGDCAYIQNEPANYMDRSYRKPGYVSNASFYFIYDLQDFSQAWLIMQATQQDDFVSAS